ncbi:glycosyltransferase family 2 protein [Microvirga rosea]|uniref:glycosyltransferase family 2 protein n=1 Tax=Microvirga rosea TaxID=2715425 RepID=UPI001D0ABA83|nr:glycosyltransferase family 2 protein [Microvirga rosea]MCB8822729.1 glycosyltransferase [Microvirga rosea]
MAPDIYLLKTGMVEETLFYRALAQELGVPFTLFPRLSRHSRYPESILAGLAPLQSATGFLMAPSGEILTRLLRARTMIHRQVVVTTPTRLRQEVMRTKHRSIAYHGANALCDRSADLSIRDGLSRRHVAGLAVLSGLFAFWSVAAPATTLAVLAAALSPLFFAAVVLRLATILLDNPVAPARAVRREADSALPIYTIIAPLYRERRIATRLVAALSQIDYPAAKLDIKFVLEADDEETPAALAAIAMPGCIDVIVAPPGHPRTKPRALNIALPLARGSYTVIYDAEDVPDADQLRMAVAGFAAAPPDTACLQARLTIDNTDDTWLTRLFTIEYAALFDVFNPGLAEIGSPVALGGTSNHFRTDVLRTIHGWDAWNVTEDADIGIRLARFGYRVRDLPSSTLEEAPLTLRAWMNQRTRWMKGFMQTSISHSRAPWKTMSQLGPWRWLAAMVLTYGTVMSALAFPIFTGLFVYVWAGTPPVSRHGSLLHAWSGTLFVMGMAAMFLPACAALKRRRLWRLLPWVLLLPLYYGLVSMAAWRSIWEAMREPFRWNKTHHGFAKTSRSGLLQKHHASAADTTLLKTSAP